MTSQPRQKRIAVITASPPGENGVGQNYIRDLVEVINDQAIHLMAVLKDERQWRHEDRETLADYSILDQRYEFPKSVGPGPLKYWSADLAFQVMTIRHARKLTRQILKKVAEYQIDTILIVLESPLLMLVGESLCRTSPCPVTILVWDHPDHVATTFGHSGYRLRRLHKAFERSVSCASGALTVAPKLKELLSKTNPELPIELFRSPSRPRDLEPAPEGEFQDRPFVVGFAGSVTSPDELELLQQSLDRLRWRVGKTQIVLRLFGKRFTLSAPVGRNIQYRGFLPTQTDVVDALAGCDVCFLPQPFSATRKLVAEYSFPTKLSSYLASGRPVLVFAPITASLAKFKSSPDQLRSETESNLGFHCEHNSESELAALITRLVEDRDFYLLGCQRAKRCALTSFRFDDGAARVRSAMKIQSTNWNRLE